MVYISIVDHRGQGGFRVAGCEFVLGVLFPEFDEIWLGHWILLMGQVAEWTCDLAQRMLINNCRRARCPLQTSIVMLVRAVLFVLLALMALWRRAVSILPISLNGGRK